MGINSLEINDKTNYDFDNIINALDKVWLSIKIKLILVLK